MIITSLNVIISHTENWYSIMMLGSDYEYTVDHNEYTSDHNESNQMIDFKCNIAGVFHSATLSLDYEQAIFKYKELMLHDHIDKDSMTVVKSFLLVWSTCLKQISLT